MSEQKSAIDEIPYLEVPTIPIDIKKRTTKEGITYLKSNITLENHPDRITERLKYWADATPDTIFLAQRGEDGEWKKLSYGEVWQKIQGIAQYLLNSDASIDRPIAILSGNSLEHGLLSLAAMHVGIPYAPVSPAYSLKSDSFEKLAHCLNSLTPGLVFVQDGSLFSKAIESTVSKTKLITVKNELPGAVPFKEITSTKPTLEVTQAYNRIGRNTLAKILFTSGSTDLPKGVMNTHGNLTTNWQQITQTFPFVKNGGLHLMDWLPWNHTFGSNHNFGLVMYNGGTLYIDEGNPTPKGILQSVKNLKEFAPTVYFNVPKGFEEVIPFLENDVELRNMFFSRLKMLFYAGASISQHVWDDLERLSIQATGKKILISSGFGMTETSPSAMFSTVYGSRAGVLGVPVPGLEVKLVADGDKLEARFRGPNLTPGYWRNKEATTNAFDEEGFYKTSEALKFINKNEPNTGMLYDGRIAEDFKLSSGTWVHVGVLRSRVIAEGKGLIKDVIITGHDMDFVGAILLPDLGYCAKLLGNGEQIQLDQIGNCQIILEKAQEILDTLARKSTGGSTRIKRALFADFELSTEKGEVTDKGSVNQRAVLSNRKEVVDKLYRGKLAVGILETIL